MSDTQTQRDTSDYNLRELMTQLFIDENFADDESDPVRRWERDQMQARLDNQRAWRRISPRGWAAG